MPSLALSYRHTITIWSMRADPEQCLLTLMKDSATVPGTNTTPRLIYLTRRWHKHSACKWFLFIPSNVSYRHTITSWNMRAPPQCCLSPVDSTCLRQNGYGHKYIYIYIYRNLFTLFVTSLYMDSPSFPMSLPYSSYQSILIWRFGAFLAHTVFTTGFWPYDLPRCSPIQFLPLFLHIKTASRNVKTLKKE